MTLSVVATEEGCIPDGCSFFGFWRMNVWKTITTGSGRVCQCPQGQQAAACRAMLAWLEERVSPHPAAHGYTKGRSVVTALGPHVGPRYLAHLDIVSFFRSTTQDMVAGGLMAAGLSRAEAEAIAAVCCYRGRLPVGACTSPLLSNLACIPLDRVLADHFTYTRYSDQLLISSDYPLYEGWMRDTIRAHGYEVNEKKSTLLVRGRTSMIVMGYQIGDKELSRPRAFRRRERARRHNEEVQIGS